MAKNTNFTKEDEIKEIELDVLEVEENAYIVKVDGWRMRVYFADKKSVTGGKIKAKYTGDIKDPHSVNFEKLK